MQCTPKLANTRKYLKFSIRSIARSHPEVRSNPHFLDKFVAPVQTGCLSEQGELLSKGGAEMGNSSSFGGDGEKNVYKVSPF